MTAIADDLTRLEYLPLIEVARLAACQEILEPLFSGLGPEELLANLQSYESDVRNALLLGLLSDATKIGGLRMYFYGQIRGLFALEVAVALDDFGLNEHSELMKAAVRFSTGVAAEEFDARLTALSGKFDAAGDIGSRLVKVARTSSNLTIYLRRIGEQITQKQRLEWLDTELLLYDSDWSRPDGLPLPLLACSNEGYGALYATAWFGAELANGGADQFFSNSAGRLAPVVVEALRDMELEEYASALAAACNRIGIPYPFDTELRYDQMELIPDWEEMMDDLTSLIDPWGEDFQNARLQYAERRNVLPLVPTGHLLQ